MVKIEISPDQTPLKSGYIQKYFKIGQKNALKEFHQKLSKFLPMDVFTQKYH